MIMRRLWILLISLASVVPATASEVAAPKVSIERIDQLPADLPYPYDEKADADKDVAAAFDLARQSGKRVVIDFGGNWCADCRILAGVMELPEVKAFVETNYVVVTVDVARFNKNMHIPARYGFSKLDGVPTVLIVDADGTMINATNSSELANAREMSPQAIANWLARWAKPQS
jgi:thiol-disulfide isomerase/thioredoxin